MKIDRELFRTGIPLIDNQHEKYLDLLDGLYELCRDAQVERERVDASLEELLNFAVEHFDAEEFLMLGTRYPHYDVHRAKHDEFRNEIDRLSSLGGETMTASHLLVQLTEWLLEWFCEQTQTHDRRLANYLRKNICSCADG